MEDGAREGVMQGWKTKGEREREGRQVGKMRQGKCMGRRRDAWMDEWRAEKERKEEGRNR